MRIEIQEGPPSRENEDADLYVVAYPANGRPKLLGGPMTEANAMAMVKEIQESARTKKADAPVQAPAQSTRYQWLTPVFMVVIAALFIISVTIAHCAVD